MSWVTKATAQVKLLHVKSSCRKVSQILSFLLFFLKVLDPVTHAQDNFDHINR